MASANTTTSRLVALPDSLLGIIFDELEDGEDRRALMQTCKQLHNNPEFLSKINCVTLFLDKWHGTIQRQLSTVIPGSAITHMVVCGCERTAKCVDQRITFRSPVAHPLTTAFYRPEHQQLLHQITHLELDEMCAIKDAPNISAFVRCLRDCMPNMKHLTVGSVSNDNVNDLLRELPQLELETLNLTVAEYDLSEPGTGCILPSGCLLLARLQTLQHLTIDCEFIDSTLSPLTTLTRLQSFHMLCTWDDEDNDYFDDIGLNEFLRCAPNLSDLSLPYLPEVPISQSLRCISIGICNMINLPTRATLPFLSDVEIINLIHDPVEPQAQLEGILDGLADVVLRCEKFWLESDYERCPCAGFLHVLSSYDNVFECVDDLECSNIYFGPGELSQLAACFVSLERLTLKKCCFVPGDVTAEICDFSMLESCTFRGIDEVSGEDELEMRFGEDACTFGSFCEGLGAACAAVQARRDSEMPPLEIELVNFTDTLLREHIYDLSGEVSAMLLASEEAPKVSLRSTSDYSIFAGNSTEGEEEEEDDE